MEARPESGEKRMRAAIETFRSLGRPVDEARCLLDVSRLLRATGRDGSAETDQATQLLVGSKIEVFLQGVG